jgi:hypothetical protein
MAFGAPALLLLGVHEFPGTPISKGYETGFEWHVDPSNNRLVINTDADGNLTCWLVLELPTKIHGFKAETSTGTHLRTYQKSLNGSTQMVVIVKDTATPETPFDWPSGSRLFILRKMALQCPHRQFGTGMFTWRTRPTIPDSGPRGAGHCFGYRSFFSSSV